MTDKLLKPAEIALALGVSRSFAYHLIRSGELRSVRIGRSVRVHPQDLEAYIKFHTSGTELTTIISEQKLISMRGAE